MKPNKVITSERTSISPVERRQRQRPGGLVNTSLVNDHPFGLKLYGFFQAPLIRIDDTHLNKARTTLVLKIHLRCADWITNCYPYYLYKYH
ncbi:hypothetical protein J6590_086829 [Homalodisca vitripennis]|nr:hypothetical protein J6590_086829 [Homalodisca vitripennis]